MMCTEHNSWDMFCRESLHIAQYRWAFGQHNCCLVKASVCAGSHVPQSIAGYGWEPRLLPWPLQAQFNVCVILWKANSAISWRFSNRWEPSVWILSHLRPYSVFTIRHRAILSRVGWGLCWTGNLWGAFSLVLVGGVIYQSIMVVTNVRIFYWFDYVFFF